MENRNGLIVDAEVFQANGTAERDAALQVTPHVAQNHARPGGSAIDNRTTRHPGYTVSQRKRKRIEECFGWLKTIALMRKVRHHGVCICSPQQQFRHEVENTSPAKRQSRPRSSISSSTGTRSRSLSRD